jgi:threonine dehydrogenase-like Zn-dependent dehydrogenase
LVKAAAGPGFTLRDVPRPAIRDNEVLIRVRRAGVCGTDVHIYNWDAWAQGRCHPPFTVGHEFAGDVVQVGHLVTDVREGDRVTAEGHIVCGRCHQCRTGNAHVCPNTCIIGVDRVGLTSLAMIREAPAARQIPTAKMPIGPQPVTSTVEPGTSVFVSAVWNALPIGS